MKKIVLSFIVLYSVANLHAQFVYDYLKAADNYFGKKDYASAAEYYEKYLNTHAAKTKTDGYNPYTIETKAKKSVTINSKQQAVYNLAESYRLLTFYAKAEPQYKQIIDENKNAFPLAPFYYATTLRALEKFAEAENAFHSFLNDYKDNDQYSDAAKREIQNLQFIQKELKKKDISLYSVIKAGSELNPEGANYAPLWLNDNTILFTSTRATNAAEKNNVHANRLYQAVYTNGTAKDLRPLFLSQQKDIQQGVASLSPNGNTLFVTRWTVTGGKKNSSLWLSRKSGDIWTEPVKSDAINTEGYNTQQPFVMPDGKHVLFASDRPGGVGGFDLYIADLDASGTVSNVQNLGSTINTSFDEQAPYYHAASNSLIFSGNGRVGMGGFDFFQSKGQAGSWSEPVNMGYPVNSVKDDIYFVSRGDAKNILSDVLLSSDRSAACCLELFSLKKQRLLKQVTGKVVNCETRQPLQGAVINVYDTVNNKVVFTKTIEDDGNYNFTLDEFQPLKAVAVAEGYEEGQLKFYTPADEESNRLNNPEICLVKVKIPEVGEVEVIENIYYQFDKYKLEPASFPALDKIVKMLKENPSMVIELSGHTDSKGSDAYNERLSQLRAESCVEYIVSQGIDRSRLTAKGYGEKIPLAPNTDAKGKDNPAGREKNRRTEFKVLKK
jgi:OOP family OmpA-OmpF porin